MSNQPKKVKEPKAVPAVVAPVECAPVALSPIESLESVKSILLEIGEKNPSLAVSVNDAVEAINHACSRVIHINKALKVK